MMHVLTQASPYHHMEAKPEDCKNCEGNVRMFRSAIQRTTVEQLCRQSLHMLMIAAQVSLPHLSIATRTLEFGSLSFTYATIAKEFSIPTNLRKTHRLRSLSTLPQQCLLRQACTLLRESIWDDQINGMWIAWTKIS